MKNLTDKIAVFPRKVRDKNAPIVNFNILVKPSKLGENR